MKARLRGRQTGLKSYPFELSGGMQQRAGIAAAMLLEPCVLLADEPTSALDVTVQKQVLEALRSACRTCGTAMVLVTHNIGVIGAMADRYWSCKMARRSNTGGRRKFYGSRRRNIRARFCLPCRD